MLRLFFEWFDISYDHQLHCSLKKKKKAYAEFTAVCNASYNYVSIFLETNYKNEVNYFLGLILVVVTRVMIKTNIVIELEKSTNSMVLLMVLLPWFYNPVLSTLSQMQTIPAASSFA